MVKGIVRKDVGSLRINTIIGTTLRHQGCRPNRGRFLTPKSWDTSFSYHTSISSRCHWTEVVFPVYRLLHCKFLSGRLIWVWTGRPSYHSSRGVWHSHEFVQDGEVGDSGLDQDVLNPSDWRHVTSLGRLTRFTSVWAWPFVIPIKIK